VPGAYASIENSLPPSQPRRQPVTRPPSGPCPAARAGGPPLARRRVGAGGLLGGAGEWAV